MMKSAPPGVGRGWIDIADMVAFLASDEARWLTGVTLAANGGLVTAASNIMAYGQDQPGS
jgi:NAD(P)-dependent dehydrogenase (short-subunit alcohol dehydrogenase family)